jgi:superkiller protein 3
LIERDEEEVMKKEIDKRRMRLGAEGPEQLRKDVGREVWGSSKVRIYPFFQSSPFFRADFVY